MLECRYNEGQQDETTDRISGKTYYLYSGATASGGTTSEEAKDTTESGSTGMWYRRIAIYQGYQCLQLRNRTDHGNLRHH